MMNQERLKVALDTLVQIAQDNTVDPDNRLSAATALLSYCESQWWREQPAAGPSQFSETATGDRLQALNSRLDSNLQKFLDTLKHECQTSDCCQDQVGGQ